MNLFLIVGGFLLVGGVLGEKEDESYECLKSAIGKMSNSSCPLITPEVEHDIDEYARLYTACTKGHYLIHGCNETEWIHACTRRVANMPSRSSSNSLRGYHDADPMWKYCHGGIKDLDFECAVTASASISKNICPELFSEASRNFSYKTMVTKSNACLKKVYVAHGCREDQWIRVCNKQVDKMNVGANGGQNFIDFFRKTCGVDPAFNCLENAVAKMNDDSCPEVSYAKAQNETAEEIMRQQTFCFKRLYINDNCKIADWKEVCNSYSFSFQSLNDSTLMQSYCNL